MASDIRVVGPLGPRYEEILTTKALGFVADLQRRLGDVHRELLVRRERRLVDLSSGLLPEFPDETAQIRQEEWRVATEAPDLEDRRVEITGPVERKMMINALNSGASAFMADFEDALSPTWANVVEGQANLIDAVRREISFVNPDGGKEYRLDDKVATLMVRPRGWHLEERHVLVDGTPVSASLFDFGLYFFHNAEELIRRGSGPYFYLPKLESHVEAKLWNEVFLHAQEALGIPRGTIRATVLIETILAAFEMDEILWELREHAAGLNAGRWDYIFSIIRKFPTLPSSTGWLPDRSQITMAVPFMRAYTDLLVRTCHRRGAHAIGGMAAFIPSRRDREVNERALAKVREDKEREAAAGFDGTWVAHPDLVPVAREIFDRQLGKRPHQKEVLREGTTTSAELLDFRVEEGRVTEEGARLNIEVALLYLDSWLQGSGAAAIYNLMEDTATAEISRTQLWQWLWNGVELEDGRRFTPELYRDLRDRKLAKLGGPAKGRLRDAAEILDELVLSRELVPFLTLVAYPRLR